MNGIPTRDLTNEKFSRLTVLYRAENKGGKHPAYQCQCSCGAFPIVRSAHLLSGSTRSCGCLRRECAAKRGPENTTHGHARHGEKPTKEYVAWRGCVRRYDGVPDFPQFLIAVGPAPSRGAKLRHSEGTFAWTS